MKKISQLILALSLVGFSSYSQADLLIEPVLGYNISSNFETSPNDILVEKLDYDGRGLAYGGRLGYQNLGFQLGIDYLQSSIDLDEKGIKDNLSLSEWGGFIGFKFPVLVRVYAGYIFSAVGETKSDEGVKIKYSEGSGMKLGAGFTLLPFVDINLEYRKGKFDELSIGGIDTGASTDYSAIMLGLSFPFTI